MSYVALYRKFRPADFSEVRGQDHIVTTLKNQLRTGRIGHAYLFTGTRGTGKTTMAKIFARAVNCENPGEDGPCGECECCRAIASGASMNVLEIDAASNNGVENVREIIEGAGVERHKTTEAIAHATVQLAYELDAKLIITPTASGYTTRMVSKYRPKAGIFAFAESDEVARHLNLRWGVEPMTSPCPWKDADEMAEMAAEAAKEKGFVTEGDRTVMTSGIQLAVGNTNAIRVYTVK